MRWLAGEHSEEFPDGFTDLDLTRVGSSGLIGWAWR